MKNIILALIALIGLGVSSAKADGVMCHDIYSHAPGSIVITDVARRVPGAFYNAFHLHTEVPEWVKSVEQPSLWYTKLCRSVSQWQEWSVRYAQGGMSMCIVEPGKSPLCQTFAAGPAHQTFTCKSTRYIYYALHPQQGEQLQVRPRHPQQPNFPKMHQPPQSQRPAPLGPPRTRVLEVRI